MERSEIFEKIPAAVYRAVVEVSGEGVSVKEVDFLTRWVEKLTGWSAEEIKGDPEWCLKNVHPDDLEEFLKVCRGLSLDRGPATRVFRFKRKDGSYAYIRDTLIPVSSEGRKFEVVGVWEDATKEKELFDVFTALNFASGIGVLVYRDRIVYANRAAQEILGYPEEELKRRSVDQLVAYENKEWVREIIKRRLKGERFRSTYANVPVTTGDGRVKEVFAFSETIWWEGKPAGFILFVDVTKKSKFERMFGVLKDLSRIVSEVGDELELLKEVANLLVDKAKFRMVWVGIPEKGSITPLVVRGEVGDVPEGGKLSERAVKEGVIVINPDTRRNPKLKRWRDQMVRRKLLSSCAIPIMRGGKVVAVINIYSQTPNMFTEEEIEFLKEVQREISFAMERIGKEKHMKIVSTAVEKAHDWFLVTDEEGNILYVNRAVEEISGYSADELIGRKPSVFKSGYHTTEFYKRLWETVRAGKIFEAMFVNRRKDGEIFYLEQTIVPVKIGKGELRFVGIGRDVTSEKMLQEEVARLRYMDVVTHLPNREGFLASVETAIEREKDSTHVLMVIDLHNFASMNQFYGTKTGDEILRRVAQFLKSSLFRRDIVARVGADEFGILARNVGEKDITTLMEKILSLTKYPIKTGRETVLLTLNVGASVYPKDAETVTELFEKAYTALSFAKREGENTYRFFSSDINVMVTEYFKLRERLERAVEEDRFLLYLQPFYYTDTRKIAGFEALIRLRENGKVLTPKDFIFVLERTGLMRRVEDSLLDKIGRFAEGLEDSVCVSFNVSPKSFRDPSFLEKVESVARKTKGRLMLEITERLLVEEPDHARRFLSTVREAGVKVAIDDFGTGYSSLAYLETLPVDVLKIDMEFVHRMTESPKSLAIVETVISLARRLGMQTIAEGVETEEQLNLLRVLGCDMVQGFLLARPMEESQAKRLLV